MNISVEKYHFEFKKRWDYLVKYGKNASFLFYRDYMEYHRDRFVDHSLTFWKGSNLVGLLPSNVANNKFYSHLGLTYGGFVVKQDIKMGEFLQIFLACLKYLYENNYPTLYLKLIPRIYNTLPSDELDWLLFITNSKLYRRDFTLALHQPSTIKWQNRRLRSLRHAKKILPEIKVDNTTEAYTDFWEKVLEPNLKQSHNVMPVHTFKEMHTLSQRFPDNIKQYNAYLGDDIVAGCTMFINSNVAHAQYISATSEGKKMGCLDFLFDHLINREFENTPWFDLGICNENEGRDINFGLLDWKEGFGARAISHDFYEIETSKYKLLEKIS